MTASTSETNRKRRRIAGRRSKVVRTEKIGRPVRVYTVKTRIWDFGPLPPGLVLAVLAEGQEAVDNANIKLVPRGFLVDHLHGASDRAEGVNPTAFAPSHRARALLRGREIAGQDLEAAGGTYDLAQVRSLLGGVTRQAIDKRVRAGSLVAVPGPGGRRRYPTIQFKADGSVVPGLPELQRALPTRNPWAVLNFLVQPEPRLSGKAPISLLRKGQVGLAIEAARRLGEQGT